MWVGARMPSAHYPLHDQLVFILLTTKSSAFLIVNRSMVTIFDPMIYKLIVPDYTFAFFENIVFPAKAEYFYFSAILG